MKEYSRQFPFFSLCGLVCGLCPRYHTDGISKCPGCGGLDFHIKHPTCAIVTCSRKHNTDEYCNQCLEYPCTRYSNGNDKDSFITYRNVLNDFSMMEDIGTNRFQSIIISKMKILEILLSNFNDGRRKNFYCLAVNLLSLEELNQIMFKINNEILVSSIDQNERIKRIVTLFEACSKEKGIEIKLRK